MEEGFEKARQSISSSTGGFPLQDWAWPGIHIRNRGSLDTLLFSLFGNVIGTDEKYDWHRWEIHPITKECLARLGPGIDQKQGWAYKSQWKEPTNPWDGGYKSQRGCLGILQIYVYNIHPIMLIHNRTRASTYLSIKVILQHFLHFRTVKS